MNPSMQRGLLLLQQRRPEEALREFQLSLGDDPENPDPHAYMALSLSLLKRHVEALEAANRAVHHGPDWSPAHYVKASVLDDMDRLPAALEAVDEAIRLDPFDPDYHALKSSVLFQQSKWDEALTSADHGLAADPEHVKCGNLRAMAMRQLGRKEEAAETLNAALRRDPDNPVTHANLGWNLLHQGKHREALESFREALRQNPNLEMARMGIVTALKARHPFYAVMMRLFLRLSRFPPRAQLALVIGAIVGVRVLGGIGESIPAVAPYVGVLYMCYLLFVFATWLADPFFNLLLRLDRFGRYALSSRDMRTSNWFGIALIAAVAAGAFMITMAGRFHPWLVLMPMLIVFPVITAARSRAGLPRLGMLAYTGAVATFFLAWLLTGVQWLDLYLWGCVLSTWMANVIPRDNAWE